MTEEWRISPRLPEYEVSSFGRVRRIRYQAQMPNGGLRWYGGQIHVGQISEGRLIFVFRRKSYKIHQLVCEAFNGPKPFPEAVVCHKDENYLNNSASNLKWGTQKENLNYPAFRQYCADVVRKKMRGISVR